MKASLVCWFLGRLTNKKLQCLEGVGVSEEGNQNLERDPYEEEFERHVPPGHHFQAINIWRSTDRDRDIEMMPLALCDFTTVRREDIISNDGVRTIEPYRKLVAHGVAHHPEQVWCTSLPA